MSLHYYILDVECTGLGQQHEINQISVIRCSDGAICSERIAVKHPELAAQQALDIQGITRADLKKGKPALEVINIVDDFLAGDNKTIEHRCVVGHNVKFDRRFCHKTWEEYKRPFPANLWLCTIDLGKHYVKKTDTLTKLAAAQKEFDFRIKANKPKFGLNILMKGLGLPHKEGAHDAIVDTQNTETLFNFFMNSNEIDHLNLIKRLPHFAENSNSDLDVSDF